jgi:hypothetical protein
VPERVVAALAHNQQAQRRIEDEDDDEDEYD